MTRRTEPAGAAGGHERAARPLAPLHASSPSVPSPLTASVLPIGGDVELWVSPAVVRQRIGAWAYEHAAAGERPGAPGVRQALAVAAALAELARALWRYPADTPLWETDVSSSPAHLARLTGVSTRQAVTALTLLAHTGIVVHAGPVGSTGPVGPGGHTVRLVREAWEPAPTVGAIGWESARERLRGAAAALPPALAVLRELAHVSGPIPDMARAPYVRYSVRDLEAATQFGRSTVSAALAALERAGLIAVDARRGQTMRCALTPVALGQQSAERAHTYRAVGPDHVSSVSGPAVSDGPRVAAPPGAGERRRQRAAGVPALPTMPLAVSTSDASPVTNADPVLIGEFAGTPIYAPPGTALVLECDAQGRWVCRVGPFLRLGPVARPVRPD